MPLSAGDKLGPYEILALLGAGGMGEVYKARDTRLDRIAVLPFTNMSDSKGDEYFSDGLAEEILNLLVRISELKVTARTSSFAFRGKSKTLPRSPVNCTSAPFSKAACAGPEAASASPLS